MNKVSRLFKTEISIEKNKISVVNPTINKIEINQDQTKKAFSEKWTYAHENGVINNNNFLDDQKKWFLKLYGFSTEIELKKFLKDKIILDAGCGIGYKTSWIADLSENSTVIGIDISDSINIAAAKYKEQENLFFVKGDISNTKFKHNVFDLVICDQVLMHTEKPNLTLKHLSKLVNKNGFLFYYFYREKALPRELIDNYFRKQTHQISDNELWELSSQLTELGKNLSELNCKIASPEIP